jgi:hypothetical protein
VNSKEARVSLMHSPTNLCLHFYLPFIGHWSIPNSFKKKPRDGADTFLEYPFLHLARPRANQVFSLSTILSPWAVARDLLLAQGAKWARAQASSLPLALSLWTPPPPHRTMALSSASRTSIDCLTLHSPPCGSGPPLVPPCPPPSLS